MAADEAGQKPPEKTAEKPAEKSAEKPVIPPLPRESIPAAIKDLELQWQDHFHMRDQSWRTLNNSALIFIGAVGADIYAGIPVVVMMAAYAAVAAASIVGIYVAAHHRYVQKHIKFPIIMRYENALGLTPQFEDILKGSKKAFLGGTSFYIIVGHIAILVIALAMLGFKVHEGIDGDFFSRAAAPKPG